MYAVISFVVCVIAVTCTAEKAREKRKWGVGEIDGSPLGKEFVIDHHSYGMPLVMRNGCENSPASILWEDDDFLAATRGPSTQARVIDTDNFKTGGPLDYFIGELYHEDGLFEEFMEEFKRRKITIATVTPTHLKKNVVLPCSIQCGDILDQRLIDSFMWMSNQGLSTKIHRELGDSIICVYRGKVKVDIFQPDDSDELYLNEVDNSVSEMTLDDAQDEGLKPTSVHLETKDCMFMPANSAHSVTSSGDVIVVTVLWKFFKMLPVNERGCSKHCNLDLTINNVQYTKFHNVLEEIATTKNFVRTMRTDGQDGSKKFLEDLVVSKVNFGIQSEHGNMLLHFSYTVLDFIDRDRDGFISDEEFDVMSQMEWMALNKQITDLLDLIEYYNSLNQSERRSEL